LSKNIKILIISTIVITIVAVLSYLVVNNITNREELPRIGFIDIYFIDTTTNKLVVEPRHVPQSDLNTMVSMVLSEFMSPSTITSNINSIPNSIEVEEIVLDDGDLIITFSEEYRELSPIQEILGRSALTWTVTGIEGIENLRVYVQGQELLKSTGEPIGNLNRNNVLLNPQIVSEEIEFNSRMVDLYFGNEDITGLLLERRLVQISSDRPLVGQILDELLQGSDKEGFYSYIPAETRVLDINITDNIAYVDLSREFDTRPVLGVTVQELAIYSIVNSLTSISELNIEEVQFLIEAQKLSEFNGYFDLSRSFKRNEDLID